VSAVITSGLVALVSFFPTGWPTVLLVPLAVGIGIARPPVSAVFGAVDVGVTAAAKALGSTADAGPVLGLWGVGSLVGGLVAARFGDASRRIGVLLLLLVGLAVGHGTLAAATSSVPAMAMVIFVAGAMIAPTYRSIYAFVDSAAPSGTVTEAFAWLEAAVCIGTALGSAGAGMVAQHVGPPSAFVLAVVAGAVGVAVAARGVRTLTSTRQRPVNHGTVNLASGDGAVSAAAA
jgi:predicted MFS family arabinose efflux permease